MGGSYEVGNLEVQLKKPKGDIKTRRENGGGGKMK